MNAGKIKTSTKALIGLIIVFPSLMQIDVVKNYFTPIVAAHPKMASVIAAITMISALLHSPQLQAVFQQFTEQQTPTATITQETTITKTGA